MLEESTNYLKENIHVLLFRLGKFVYGNANRDTEFLNISQIRK